MCKSVNQLVVSGLFSLSLSLSLSVCLSVCLSVSLSLSLSLSLFLSFFHSLYFALSFSLSAVCNKIPEAEKQRVITDEDIYDIAEQVADRWWKLARSLSHAGREGLAFPLSSQGLREIKTKFESDEERLVEALRVWRDMDPRHRWGLLWDTLFKCSLGAVADIVVKRPSKSNNIMRCTSVCSNDWCLCMTCVSCRHFLLQGYGMLFDNEEVQLDAGGWFLRCRVCEW